MGVFDYIRCRMPLPKEPAPPENDWFQTKFADVPYLERYTIEADDRLIHNKPRYDITPDSEVCGEVEVPFHGDIEFGEFSTETGEWWTYTARFTNGRCVRVWLSEHEFVKRPSSGSAMEAKR